MRLLFRLKELFARTASADALMEAAREWNTLKREGEALLGPTGWTLLRRYGRLMSGTYSGQYVSALPASQVRALLQALQRGEL